MLLKDGYLFLHKFLPSELLRRLALLCEDILREKGWVDGSQENGQLIANMSCACANGEPRYEEVNHELFSLEELHALAHNKQVTRFFEKLLGDRIFCHPRIFVRVMFPYYMPAVTYPHQDFATVGGTEETFTLWIPLMNCQREQGSLELVPGSHKDGLRPVRNSFSVGDATAVKRGVTKWIGGDFMLGDVLIFHSLTLHRAHSNISPFLRISLDFRYQRERDPIHPGVLESLGHNTTWDEVYKNWQRSDLKYYWRNHKLNYYPIL